jgi:hypothetical protein
LIRKVKAFLAKSQDYGKIRYKYLAVVIHKVSGKEEQGVVYLCVSSGKRGNRGVCLGKTAILSNIVLQEKKFLKRYRTFFRAASGVLENDF